LDYFDHLNKEHLQRSLVKRLEKLGHRVTLEPKGPSRLVPYGTFRGAAWTRPQPYSIWSNI
jgi:hypothetical protein